MLRMLPGTDQVPSLVDYDDGDGIEEGEKQEEEQLEEEDDFIGIIFPSIIFSYLSLFLKPSFQRLTPNLRVTVDFLFPLDFQNSVDTFCWFDLLMFIIFLTSFHQGLHSEFASNLRNCQWLLGLIVLPFPSTLLGLYDATDLGNVRTCSKPFSGCPLSGNKVFNLEFGTLGNWPAFLDSFLFSL